MTRMYDSNDYAAKGPQVTARPGTKRHLRQCVARATFFNVLAVTKAAETRRLQARIDEVATEILVISPPAGSG
jgi:hypothetical protein